MRQQTVLKQKMTRQFVHFAATVSNTFPDLDLRFNLQSGTNRIRYSAPTVSADVFELIMNEEQVQQLIHEATFQIKQLTGQFDA